MLSLLGFDGGHCLHGGEQGTGSAGDGGVVVVRNVLESVACGQNPGRIGAGEPEAELVDGGKAEVGETAVQSVPDLLGQRCRDRCGGAAGSTKPRSSDSSLSHAASASRSSSRSDPSTEIATRSTIWPPSRHMSVTASMAGPEHADQKSAGGVRTQQAVSGSNVAGMLCTNLGSAASNQYFAALSGLQ